MSNIFETIKYYILSQKEKQRKKRLEKYSKTSYTNKTSKRIIGSAADVTLSAQTNNIIDDVKNNVAAIVKKTNCNPDDLLDYIKAANTPVYKIDNADKLLASIGEEEGLICEKEGLQALYLSFITGRNLSLKTPAMFILRNGEIDKYYMLHNFYRWYSLKSNLPGFEYRAQKLFKKYLSNPDVVLKRLSMTDILSVKEAIARDQEASTFVIAYTNEQEGSKKVIDKIKNDGGANV